MERLFRQALNEIRNIFIGDRGRFDHRWKRRWYDHSGREWSDAAMSQGMLTPTRTGRGRRRFSQRESLAADTSNTVFILLVSRAWTNNCLQL
jgi:hypothetical protein